MATQYWVGDYFIDVTRNQISQQMRSQTIPPKALAVLTCLAKNVNHVVSHEELLSQVWPGIVVTPNTLQRSIAQLRKALGEDSQSYIKTHAKQGYSLECEVRWQSTLDEGLSTAEDTPENEIDNTANTVLAQQDVNSASATKNVNPISLWLSAIMTMIVLGVIAVTFLAAEPTSALSVKELRAVTATDNKEHSGMYSPDGEYMVFLRYVDKLCSESHLWAKNIRTQKETQLTQNMGRFGDPSFSKDGKQLVIIKSEDCEQPETQKECYKLMSIDFAAALIAPQSPSMLMACKNSRIAKPTFLNDNDIVFEQNFSNHWKLARYSIADNKSSVIYALEDGSVIDYDYSVQDNLLALISVHADGNYYIEVLKPNGELITSHLIEYPPEIPKFRYIYPNHTPTSGQLMFSTGRQLFTLSYEGEITNISLPLDEPMGSPKFHPNGKRMLMVKGNWDSDILSMPITDIPNAQANSYTVTDDNRFPIIDRSTRAEGNAMYQPNGDLIAVTSERTGDRQVWIIAGGDKEQLSQFPTDTFISGMSWSNDGQSLLVNGNGTLVQVGLDSTHQDFAFTHPINRLFQWDSEANTALVTIRKDGGIRFGELDLNRSEFTLLNEKRVYWAQKTADDRLIYTDHMDRFWAPGPAEDQLIEPLVNQGSNKGFVITNNVIYGINETSQLWSYNLNTVHFEYIGKAPKNVDYITDINGSDILFTIKITAKKELAEIILAD